MARDVFNQIEWTNFNFHWIGGEIYSNADRTTNLRLDLEGTNFYAGRYGANEEMTLSYDVQAGIKEVSMMFEFFEFDTWNGENFYMHVNNTTIDLGSFSGTVNEGSSGWIDMGDGIEIKRTLTDTGFFGGSQYIDQKFLFEVRLPGGVVTSDELDVTWSSSLNESVANESWGVDSLIITAVREIADNNDVNRLEGYLNSLEMGEVSDLNFIPLTEAYRQDLNVINTAVENSSGVLGMDWSELSSGDVLDAANLLRDTMKTWTDDNPNTGFESWSANMWDEMAEVYTPSEVDFAAILRVFSTVTSYLGAASGDFSAAGNIGVATTGLNVIASFITEDEEAPAIPVTLQGASFERGIEGLLTELVDSGRSAKANELASVVNEAFTDMFDFVSNAALARKLVEIQQDGLNVFNEEATWAEIEAMGFDVSAHWNPQGYTRGQPNNTTVDVTITGDEVDLAGVNSIQFGYENEFAHAGIGVGDVDGFNFNFV